MLVVTVRLWLMMPVLLPSSRSQKQGPAPSALTWWMVTRIWLPDWAWVTAPVGEGVFGDFADVNVAGELGAAAAVDGAGGDLGVADDGGVYLAGVDGCAVLCDGVVDDEADGGG
jgi:hypothetical protein